jgi:hypothetical protein
MQRLHKTGQPADVSLAIAPQPSQAYNTANTMVDVTDPGGRIYVAARSGESTAQVMADVFRYRYGIEVKPQLVPRSQVPFASSYFRGDEMILVIDFTVPR